MQATSHSAERIHFTSGNETCIGWLHLPANPASVPPPVVLMGNGLATEWHFGTRDFIHAFTSAGIATFNFDYRHFGESAGQPRQLIDFQKQLDDWRAALACLRSRTDIDPARLALWGSSLGGGHAIMLAAEQPELRAVIAQVPHLDSRAAMKSVPIGQLLRTLGHALLDKLGAALGLPPHTIRVVTEPGNIGLLGKPGWKEHYLSLVPPDSAWRNATPARSIFTAGNYNPIDVAGHLKMPVLLVYGRHDAGVPAATVEAAAQRMPNATLAAFAGDHFAVYGGPLHDKIVQQEVDFLRQNLQK